MRDWEHVASSDPEYVAREWPPGPYNAGIACGPSRLVVVDLDCHEPLPADWLAEPGISDGKDVFAALAEWAGETTWPATYWVQTPSNGWHLYFAAPGGCEIRNSAGLLGPSVDVRVAGGYVLAAGSVIGGTPYEVLDARPPIPLPSWLAQLLTAPPPRAPGTATERGNGQGRLAGLVRTVASAPRGERNHILNWAAWKAAELEDAAAAARELLAAALTAGLGEAEAKATINSGLGIKL